MGRRKIWNQGGRKKERLRAVGRKGKEENKARKEEKGGERRRESYGKRGGTWKNWEELRGRKTERERKEKETGKRKNSKMRVSLC